MVQLEHVVGLDHVHQGLLAGAATVAVERLLHHGAAGPDAAAVEQVPEDAAELCGTGAVATTWKVEFVSING